MKSNLALKKSLYALIVSLGIASPLTIATAADSSSTEAKNTANVKLTQVKGRVMVNTGTIYTQVNSGATLTTGTKLVTSHGASAMLVYKDGCVKKVEENKILTIGNATECIAKTFNEKSYQAAAVGDSGTDAVVPVVSAAASNGPATSIMAWSAGMIGMTFLDDHNHHNNPAISQE